MNERIKELVGQAKFMAEETINRQISKNAELDAFAEKFAELIVRECITRIEGCATTPEDDEFVKGYNKGVSKVASQVKHHFGVE